MAVRTKIARLDILEVTLLSPSLDASDATSGCAGAGVVEKLKAAAQDLELRELRLIFRPPWFRSESLDATRSFLSNLRAAISGCVKLSLFAELEVEQFSVQSLELVRQELFYPVLSYPKEGRPADKWNAFQVAFADWRQAADQGRIYRPSVRIEVDPRVDLVEIYNYITLALDIRAFNIVLPSGTRGAPPSFDPDSYVEPPLALFKKWIRDDNPNIKIEYFNDIARAVKFGSGMGWSKWTHEVVQHIDFDEFEDFSLTGIDLSVGLRPGGERAGSIAELLNAPSTRTLLRARRKLPRKCKACTWSRVCAGGEMRHRADEAGTFDRESIFCAVHDELLTAATAALVEAGMPLEIISSRINRPTKVQTTGLEMRGN